MALDLVVLPYASKNALSFNPNFNSGIPLRQLLHYNLPTISDLITFPFGPINIFNFSITSKNTSFFLCLIPGALQGTALENTVIAFP